MLSFAAIALVTASCKKAEDKAADTATPADTTAVTEETAEAAPATDSATMQKAWEDYMTPGEVHKVFAMDAGSWKCESKMWMDPAKAPEMATMTADIKMTFGGRYQEAAYKGNIMGMPFEGKGTLGFDNASGKVVSTWHDNMSTGIMYMTGDYDNSKKVITLTGEMTDLVTKKIKNYREIYTIVDDNTRKMEMFDTDPSGKEYKSMEITMTRVK